MKKRINLALQGGGAHGAFTWGVLDRILQDDDIEIAAMSGTSAGALNGAAVKAGYSHGGREGARENLNWLWSQIGAVEDQALLGWMAAISPDPSFMSKMIENSPAYAALDAGMRMFSPYALGPFYKHPLTDIVAQLDMQAVCGHDGPDLFICATNVRSGKIRVFEQEELTGDALLASSCLPLMFQAVEFHDPKTGQSEAFWDGGYTGNPALFPLFEERFPDDIVVININPLHRDEIPKDPQAIQNRINEISFNSSLFRELRAIAFVKRLLKDGALKPGSMKDILVHMISDDVLMNELTVATKMMPSPLVLARLKAAGQAAADGFLSRHKGDLNAQSTVSLDEMFS